MLVATNLASPVFAREHRKASHRTAASAVDTNGHSAYGMGRSTYIPHAPNNGIPFDPNN
jgi:hypothetical protein